MIFKRRAKKRNNGTTATTPVADPTASPGSPPHVRRPALLPARRPWPIVATDEDYARALEATGASDFTMIVNNFSLVTNFVGDERHPIPSVALNVPPGVFDFADPVLGFAGLLAPVPQQRVLRLWADDLLTISHGTSWTFTIDSAEPFDEAWLDTLFPTVDADFQPLVALIAISFVPLRGAFATSVGELDATHPMAHVLLEDLRLST